MSTPQAKTSGVKVDADQRRVAAVGAADDRDLLRVGDALLDRPVDGVDQVVVHLPAPLPVAGVQELLAEAGRAAEVDLEHRVAAVGQPLRLGVEAPAVARPRTAVDEQHHRQALRRRRRRAASGSRCSVQAVARLDDDRLHLRPAAAPRASAGGRTGTCPSWRRGPRRSSGSARGRGVNATSQVSVGAVAADDVEVAVVQLGDAVEVRLAPTGRSPSTCAGPASKATACDDVRRSDGPSRRRRRRRRSAASTFSVAGRAGRAATRRGGVAAERRHQVGRLAVGR